MPRAKFIPTTDPYHISSRCINKEWFHSPLSEVWEIFSEQLYLSQKMFNLQIHSFVLMSNHFHLLVTAPELNISQSMNYFLRESSRQILHSNERINRTFGARFFRSRIGSYHHFMTVYKYVYRNPVEANLCDYAEEYPWSTLNGLLGLSRLLIPLEEDPLLGVSEFTQTIKWLNQSPHLEDKHSVHKAIRRSVFTLPKTRKQVNHLESDLY